jgi:hypothetical protein
VHKHRTSALLGPLGAGPRRAGECARGATSGAALCIAMCIRPGILGAARPIAARRPAQIFA